MFKNQSLSLLTDLYQLTASYAYWKHRMHETESVFHLFFRKTPFKGHFALAAGLQYIVDFIEQFKFGNDEIEYLRSLGHFEEEFLIYLKELKFTCTLDAVAKGTIVFPNEPLVRISGPIIQCQLLETPLLNIINFQTLIATKAARVCMAAKTDKVVEFGLRRAQGTDGALAASRAAYIGGCAGTSNVLAGKLFIIPVVGTHAHSWVMSFDSEMEAFEKYAEAMPKNTTLLVDTYNTVQGIKNAIVVGDKLKKSGYDLNGIRLDSGDLAKLSILARDMLDDAGFLNTKIVASNDLDEYEIERLKKAGAKIDIWGVGTKLVTAFDQPALGGVYKLGAIKNSDGDWEYKVKLSEDSIKVSNPGKLDILRLCDKQGYYISDVIVNALNQKYPYRKNITFIRDDKEISVETVSGYYLLRNVFKDGQLNQYFEKFNLEEIRNNVQRDLKNFIPNISFKSYEAGIEKELYRTKQRLIKEHQNGR